jgi:hypothetical protein
VSKGRPAFRLDLLAQGAAFVALLGIFLLLLNQLREDAPRPPAPVAPVTSELPGPPSPGRLGTVLTPPPPLPEATETPHDGSRGADAARGGGASGKATAPASSSNEKAVRTHLYVAEARDRRVPGVLVNARTRRGKLRPRRTLREGDVLLDPAVPSDGPLEITVRHARWGKQHFMGRIAESPQVLHLETPRRGVLKGVLRATDGFAPKGCVISLIDSEGTISEIDEDLAYSADGTFKVGVVPGNYRVRASAPGFCPSDWARAVVALEAPAEVELIVLKASKIVGTITMPAGSDAPKQIDIELEAQTKDGPVSSVRKVGPDARGGYELKEIRPGWYRIRACDAQHDGSWATVQVVEGLPVENFTLFLDGERREAALGGVVRDTADQVLPGVTVWTRAHRVLTDDYGHFLLRLDPSQEGSVTIEKEGYVTVEQGVASEPGARDPRGIEVTLEPLD